MSESSAQGALRELADYGWITVAEVFAGGLRCFLLHERPVPQTQRTSLGPASKRYDHRGGRPAKVRPRARPAPRERDDLDDDSDAERESSDGCQDDTTTGEGCQDDGSDGVRLTGVGCQDDRGGASDCHQGGVNLTSEIPTNIPTNIPTEIPTTPARVRVPDWASRFGQAAEAVTSMVLATCAAAWRAPSDGGQEVTPDSVAVDASAVIAVWQARRGMTPEAVRDELVLLADAFKRCPAPLFARHVRAEGWVGGVDRRHDVRALCDLRSLSERLAVARQWDAQGRPAATTPAPSSSGRSMPPGADRTRSAGEIARAAYEARQRGEHGDG